jgi:hypothetical protein
METPLLPMTILAALLAAIALYVHLTLPRLTAGKPTIARALLIATGVACGGVAFVVYSGEDPLRAALMAVVGFGVVHVPAAFILFFKSLRRRAPSEARPWKS